MIDTVSSYTRLGGEAVPQDLVERFYAYMDTLPEAHRIRGMHKADLKTSRDKLFKFLSGWLGGPDLYVQEHGHPRLRVPFSIGVDTARGQRTGIVALG